MRSYERAAIFSRASRPFLAVSTSYPSSPRISAMIAATSGSSSTTRMQMRQASALCFCSVGIGKVTSGQQQQARGHCGTVGKPDAYCDLPSVLFPKWSLLVPSRAPVGRLSLLAEGTESRVLVPIYDGRWTIRTWTARAVFPRARDTEDHSTPVTCYAS